ncbi:MAG: Hpt domain-containing protein [Lachnospiraceae bacterium]|nr:Hpt domain-containing protein [Lachnospiraceae bacterium]
MNTRIEAWRNLGCDIEDAMTRFLDDEEFYLECFDSVIHDPKFDELQGIIETENVSAAFECAHTLKGLVANIGLVSLNSIMIEIVEKLRAGSLDGLLEKCELLSEERKKYLVV